MGLPDEVIPEGIHRMRILSAKKSISKSGHDVIRMVLEVYGYYEQIVHYITFLPYMPELATKNIEDLFDSCPAIRDEFRTCRWSGHELAGVVRQEDYHGRRIAKVSEFVPAADQAGLPHFPTGRGVVVYD